MPSSPDPLADDVPSFPSSTRPASRRITESRPGVSSPSKLQSNARRSSRSQSPRKRTFELDVGNSRSPQRIRVTVEAEEHLKRANVNRKLFPPSSPTRSARRHETVTTTTTTVPLNDEVGPLEGGASTPRKRGRPRRTSNGTPMPQSRKRAGTPIHRTAKQARQEYESSEAGLPSDAPTDVGGDETPKPKARLRKTPRKSSTIAAVPSSQISSTATGRKRGRPRKNPIKQPASVNVRNDTTGVASSVLASDSDAQHNSGGTAATALDDSPIWNSRTSSLLHPSHSQEPPSAHRMSHSPMPSDGEHPENDAGTMSEDYQANEAQSDLQSEDDNDGMRFNRQDTVADASDFSMIAVESLPSFQASFHASFHADNGESAEEPYEMGEETSQIISKTLDSLRRSLRSETVSPSNTIEPDRGTGREEDEDEILHQSTMATSNNGERGLSRSPRRPKAVPLSRQVFVGRGNVNDSFSSIPDSILQAATPGRLPTTQTTVESHAGDDGYDDSFSEIPEAVLTAATPKRARDLEKTIHESLENGELHQNARSVARRPSADYGSNRLPTPEETSSSNAGSKKGHEEETAAISRPRESSPPDHTDVPSSPPIRNRPRALDFGQSNIQQELNLVQGHPSLSPPRQQPAKLPQNQHQTLEAPPTNVRPSLSPIVRVGRTLQNVMSDNSSPEVREGNLGSPFRGPANNEHIHQSSLARSPSPSIRSQGALENTQISASPTRLDRSLRSNLDRNSGFFSRSTAVADDPFSSKNGTFSNARDFQEPANSKLPENNAPFVSSSDAIAGPSNGEVSRVTYGHSSQQTRYQQPPVQSVSSRGQTTSGTQGMGASHLATAHDAGLDLQEEGGRDDESLQDLNQDFDNGSAEEYDDDLDIWDIEASRTSPTKPELPHAALRPLESDVPPPRRSKIPSPWRKTARRLIYKDQIASSSQIEVEEGSQSEVEQEPPVRPRQQLQAARVQSSTQSRLPEPPREHTMQAQPRRPRHTSSPNPSQHSDEEYVGPEGPEELEDMMDYEESEGTPELGSTHDEERETQARPKDAQTPVGGDSAMDMTEYSMVGQQEKSASKAQNKPTSAKSRFFGKFDLLSFFSSPAALPTKTPPEANTPRPINKPGISQPALETRETGQTAPKEPPKALWSTGLFPPVPQKDFQPSPERRRNLFSPGQALQSNDTVADTYEPSTSVSPSPSPSPSHPASGAPSTPERQVFPSIQQKRDFTPRPGQSRGSLFSRSQASSSAIQSEVNENSPQDLGDEHDDSALTEGSEYERVPPREKPSQWDRNLSPTKSCFRSPLKPTTPGRIVSFGDEDSSPLAQTRARIGLRNGTNGSNIISQGPPLRPNFEGKENQSNFHLQQNKGTLANTTTTGKYNTERPALSRSSQPSAFATAKNNITLSQTTWSKQHWARFDEILQLRRYDPLRFQQLCALPPRDQRRSAVLLGKEVSAQNAKLVLEPWHLDVVEAFKLEVGGWDERVLARRLFALIIGEQKRRAAKTNRNTNATAAVGSVY